MEEFQIKTKKRRRESSEILVHVNPDQKSFFPATLFDISVKYVSNHLHLVESFHEFPDLIGETIFSCAAELHQFAEPSDTSLHALALFCSAYPDSVLQRINLHGCHLGVADYTEHLCLFKHLTHLDLTSCGLGDDHELIAHIAASNSLECLCLSDNGLSSLGLQKMTAPLRVLGRGPRTLQILSLADNPGITVQVIRYLKCFPALRALDVTGTSITLHDTGQMRIQLGLLHDPGASHKSKFIVEDIGWAVSVVREWMQKPAPRDVPAARTEAQKFYKKAKDPALVSQSLKTAALSTSTSSKNSIQLCFTKPSTCSDKALEIRNQTTTCIRNNTLKTAAQRISNAKCGTKNTNVCSKDSERNPHTTNKKKKPDELDAEDELMMKSYTTGMNSGKLDLWQAMNSKHW